MSKTKATKKPKKRAVGYTATLKSMGREYVGKGETVADAIDNIKLTNTVAGASILTLKKGKKSKERVLSPIQTTRLFRLSPSMREVTVKNISVLFEL